jgi:putative hemolysin
MLLGGVGMEDLNIEKERNKPGVKRKRENTKYYPIMSGGIFILIFFLLFLLSVIPAFALVNPSAVYCTANGYTYIIKLTKGGERGLCQLPGNQTVDGWEFLQGKVAQEYSYCKKMGYEIKTVQGSEKCLKFLTNECAVCVLGDGTEVEVSELMGLSFEETICGDGSCGVPENYKTCPEDCPSGGWDEYCDGVKDGRVDPDCAAGEDPDSVEAIAITMELPAGWSMISLPVRPEVVTVTTLFPGAVVVYKYRKGTGYVQVTGGENLEVGMGYWILLDNPQSYVIRGTKIVEYMMPVEDGWYMIGSCTFPAQKMVTNGRIDVIYSYAPGIGYQRLIGSEPLKPGKGYWILFSNTSKGAAFTASTSSAK